MFRDSWSEPRTVRSFLRQRRHSAPTPSSSPLLKLVRAICYCFNLSLTHCNGSGASDLRDSKPSRPTKHAFLRGWTGSVRRVPERDLWLRSSFSCRGIRARIFLHSTSLMMMWIVIFALPLLLRVLRGLSSRRERLRAAGSGATVGLKVRCFSYIKRYWISVSFFSAHCRRGKQLRDAAVNGVFAVIKHIWPQCKVEVFGSFRTGLYLPTSDIDVVILDSDIRTPQLGLRALSRALSQKGIAKNIQVIAKARVPIIKFVERKSEVAFDIRQAVSKLPPLRPLCLILKIFLQQRELNEVYSGGIGSYALLAMLIAMLQSRHESHMSPEHNLGILLVNFFDMYGRKLNTSDVGVSCNFRGTFFSKNARGFLNKDRPYLISIEDPQALEEASWAPSSDQTEFYLRGKEGLMGDDIPASAFQELGNLLSYNPEIPKCCVIGRWMM
ncbi:unnamed protein product [Rhodiola kirilowii]